jgi:serine protease Do
MRNLTKHLMYFTCALVLVTGINAAQARAADKPAAPAATAAPATVPLGTACPKSCGPPSFADIVDPLLPAVVNISTSTEMSKEKIPELPDIPEGHPYHDFFKHFFEEHYSKTPRKTTALGSGFIIDAAGYVVTNNHVIAEADEITVTLHDKDKTEFKAKVVGRDPRSDLALLKVESKTPLPFVEWGDSTKARTGDWVLAVGNPFGLASSVTAGIISTIARNISAQMRGNGGGGGTSGADIIDSYIQTDAAINLGNSGGPLFDMNGKIVGVNTAILSPSGTNIGIGFAIPSEVAKHVIEQLKSFGKTRRGWLGVRVQVVTDEIAEALGLPKARGALVGSVTDNGPAAKGGIKPRDVITQFNGTDVKDSGSFPIIVGGTEIGKDVPVIVIRDGKNVTLTIKVGEYEAAEEAGLIPSQRIEQETKKNAKEILGLTLRELTPQDRSTLQVPNDVKAVLIAKVDPYSEAYQTKGLRNNDLIVDVGGKPVTKAEEVIALIEAARKAKKKHEIFQIRRGENVLFIALNVEEEKEKPAEKDKKKAGDKDDNKDTKDDKKGSDED